MPQFIAMTDDDRLPDPSGIIPGLPVGSAVIVRSRSDDTQRKISQAIQPLCDKHGIFLLTSCEVPPASIVGDGVHIPEAARKNWRRKDFARLAPQLITTSAHKLASVTHAASWGADAVLLSPVSATQSHPGARSLGWWRGGAISRKTNTTSVYALGGIDTGSIKRAFDLGFAGIAGIGMFT